MKANSCAGCGHPILRAQVKQMNDAGVAFHAGCGVMCAHLKVVHIRTPRNGGYYDSWECELCHTRFSPVHPIDPPANSAPHTFFNCVACASDRCRLPEQVPEKTISNLILGT